MDMELGSAFMAPQLQMQQIEASRAQQQLAQVQAAQGQFELGQAQKMGKLMESMATPEGAMQQATDIPDMLDQIAQRFMGAGLPEKAGKLAADAAQIRERRANEKQNLALASQQEAQGMIKAIELSREILFGARSQDDLDRGNSLWAARTGTMSPLAGEIWSPQLMREFQDELLAAQGKLTSQDREATRNIREAEAASRKDVRDSLIAYREQIAEQRKREAQAQTKAGGGVIGSPSKEEIQQAQRLVVGKYKAFGKEKDMLAQAAFDIASEAKAIRKNNPAISAGEALQQAFGKADAAGDFGVVEGFFSDTPQYKPPKKAPAEAAVPPVGERVVGKTTFVKDGKTYVWTEAGGQRGWAPAPGGK